MSAAKAKERRWPLDAHGVLVEMGNRVKCIVGKYHGTMQLYGRVLDIDGNLLTIQKENPGHEQPRSRSAAHLWELASEDEVAPVYPTTEPWSHSGELARAEKRQRREEMLPEVDGAIAIVGAIFWPGTIVLVALAILVGLILWRLMIGPVTEAHEAGYKLEYCQGKMLPWRRVTGDSVVGAHMKEREE